MNDYQFKTQPYQHQLEAFTLCRDKNVFALLMEMGTGKSKVALDKACDSFCNGRINAVLIVAPNGVHTNWTNYEIKKHVPDYVKYNALAWRNPTASFKKSFDNLLSDLTQLAFFTINIEGVATLKGREFVKKFLTLRNVLFIVDESSRIKTPKAQRTKAIIQLGKLAKERLIMTGTPITQSPFDLYTQFKFLDQYILGHQTYTAFKHEYGIFERQLNTRTGYAFDKLEKYKNLDQLVKLIEPYSFRVTKADCLDLPDKIYQRYSVELNPVQRQHYDELKENLITEIEGREVFTPIVLTKLLRLQQITGGFLTVDEGKPVSKQLGLNNPKASLVLDLIEDNPGKIIIWARFSAEVELLAALLAKKYGQNTVVKYYGKTETKTRQTFIDRFQNNPNCRFFIGNARAGGIGITLTAANTIIYFSNDFSLETRLQSEDRIHRIGQKEVCVYIDIEAANTVDSHIINALRNKKNIADLITGDTVREWI